MKTVVGLYDELETARHVVQDLTDAGFDANDINLIAGDPDGQYAKPDEDAVHAGADSAVEGAVAGGVLGGLAGLLFGLSAFALPGLGPVIIAGPILSSFVGAGIGAASGGLVATLVEWGLSEEEAELYLEGVRRGNALVMVRTQAEEVDEVRQIMNGYPLVDVKERERQWREEGWSGYDAQARPYAGVEQDSVDDVFKEHYEKTYGESGHPYDKYARAYKFGFHLATDTKNINNPWQELRPEARKQWAKEHGEDFDDYEEAMRFAYHRAQTYMV
ncbi:MAG: hypothetical protein R3248_09845 [Candidatus Promineifilaceae bacterium]|nr:hypothetical protein [Candidatus Promineifilaceae bacterium]